MNRRKQTEMAKYLDEAVPLKGAKVVVHHDYWSYLIYWLGLDKVATLEPVPGVAPLTYVAMYSWLFATA